MKRFIHYVVCEECGSDVDIKTYVKLAINNYVNKRVEELKRKILDDYNKKAGRKGSGYTLSILKQNVLSFINETFKRK